MIEDYELEDIDTMLDEDAYLQYLEEISLEKRILEEEDE